jgi:hypothetical protein
MWLNETLGDAEHMDIPGCIMQPAHREPIARYGIDTKAFNNAEIPEES